MTWTALAFVVTVGVVAWLALSAVIALALGALVARNRAAAPGLAPASPRAAVVTRSRVSARAA